MSKDFGENLKWFLDYVSNADRDQIDCVIDIYGETASGAETSCEVEISELCGAALARIEQLEAYKNLAKERGKFILNGVELGYIHQPTSEIDTAYSIFLRCQLTDEAAAESLKA